MLSSSNSLGLCTCELVDSQNVQLIMPKAGFCVKTKKKESGQKVFINVCHADKHVDKAESSKKGGGTSWEVPFRWIHQNSNSRPPS